MSNRAWLLSALAALAVLLIALVISVTPWRTLPIAIKPLPAIRDFSAADLARARNFHAALRPWAIASWLLALVLVGIVGFTSAGSRILAALPGPYYVRAFLGVFLIELVVNFAVLPVDIRRESVLRTYGLSTQSWRGWLIDRAQHFAIGALLTGIALTFLVFCARSIGENWWIAGGAGAVLLVIIVSFGYPLVVEPIFNKFTPMADSPLRAELLHLAARDEVKVSRILVADASRRTTALNAYVSGFGSSRRIVIYDVLLAKAPASEVKLVVAHELGHAKQNDVGRFTLVGALASALGVLLVAALLQWQPLLRQAGLSPNRNPMSDPRSIALVLALIAFLTLAQQPVSSMLSRRIEARADVHALSLTRDVESFIAMQRTLSVSNLADPNPPKILYWLFATHPSAPERIAIARSWAHLNHTDEPGTPGSG